MKTKVFYFSGTGNTLSLAREISQMIGADLVSISNCVKAGNNHIHAEKDIIRKSKLKIDRICSYIIYNKKTRYKAVKNVFLIIMKPIYYLIRPAIIKELKVRAHEPADSGLQYYELIPLTDKSIIVDEKCIGCGICARVCPVENIIIANKRPEFQHRCEMCFACDEWCPTESIHHWSRAPGVKYHHPEINLTDMITE